MKQCRCEHWQTCPICYPQAFDADGNRLPIEPSPLEKAKSRIEELLFVECRILEIEQQIDGLSADAGRWRYITRDGRTRGLKIPATENKASIDAAIDKELGK
jgi:hypothetical protein